MATCRDGCVSGACVEQVGNTCDTSIRAPIADHNGVPLYCEDSVYTSIGGFASHARVYAANNVMRTEAYDALSLLPDHFLRSDIRMTIYPTALLADWDLQWQSLITRYHSWGDEVNAPNTVGMIDQIPYMYHRNIILAEQQNASQFTFDIIHEVMHSWVEDSRTIPTVIPLSMGYNLVSQLSPTSFTPPTFYHLINCQRDNTFTGKAISGYGATACSEEFAEEGATYVTDPCKLKELDSARYEYFKNTVFKGKEYIPEGETCEDGHG